MKKNNLINEEFGELLAQNKKEHAEKSRFLCAVERLAIQSQYYAICGSWISVDSASSLLVRYIGTRFLLLLCDNTRCYKNIIRETFAEVQGRRLVIQPDEPGPGGDINLGKDGLLRCGSWGTFRSEDDLLREEKLSEMEFALRFPEEQPYGKE